MRKLILLMALLLALPASAQNDQGGSVLYFGIVRKGSPMVFDPGKPELWAKDVGRAYSMLFLQQDYKDRGAPDELFEDNPDLKALVHLDIATIDVRNDPEWAWFLEHPEALLLDEHGHPITAYYNQHDSGRSGSRRNCDPEGTKPKGEACMVIEDGEIIEHNPDACKCRFSVDLGDDDFRQHYADLYRQYMSVAKPGHRRLAGATIDNSRTHYNWGEYQVSSKRASGVPVDYSHEQYVDDLIGAMDVLSRAVKEINPENILIPSACTFANVDEVNLAYAKKLMGVVDGCMAEQWAIGRPGTPMVNRPELWAFQLRVMQEINGMDKYFIALTAEQYPHGKIPDSWQDTRSITDFAHANVMLAWQNPKAMMSYWGGVAFSASSTVGKPWAVTDDHPGGKVDTFMDDYPLIGKDCGVPVGNLQLASKESGRFSEDGKPILVASGVGRRDWSKCIVIVNSGRGPFNIKLAEDKTAQVASGSSLIIDREVEVAPPDPPTTGKVLINPASCICQCDEI